MMNCVRKTMVAILHTPSVMGYVEDGIAVQQVLQGQDVVIVQDNPDVPPQNRERPAAKKTCMVFTEMFLYILAILWHFSNFSILLYIFARVIYTAFTTT
jgi:hypothetical protein